MYVMNACPIKCWRGAWKLHYCTRISPKHWISNGNGINHTFCCVNLTTDKIISENIKPRHKYGTKCRIKNTIYFIRILLLRVCDIGKCHKWDFCPLADDSIAHWDMLRIFWYTNSPTHVGVQYTRCTQMRAASPSFAAQLRCRYERVMGRWLRGSAIDSNSRARF